MKNEESVIKKSKFKQVINYISKTSNGMALGLFGTLIIGVIVSQIASFFNNSSTKTFYEVLNLIGTSLQSLVGCGIGLGVALTLKLPLMQTITSMVCGYIGGFIFIYSPVFLKPNDDSSLVFHLVNRSDPLCSYLASLLSINVYNWIFRGRKTPVDLLLIPLLGIFVTVAYIFSVSFLINYVTIVIGKIIDIATTFAPYSMAFCISVLMGMALTAPISSVAICVMIDIGANPIAAGAALIGCSVQMVGFAVQSTKDNKIGGVLSVFIGTSMLQFKNIVKKPIIWLPTIITSALLSVFAVPTTLLGYQITTNSTGAGMGTSGLVGIFTSMADGVMVGSVAYKLPIVLLITVILPACIVYVIDDLFRYAKLINRYDLSLNEVQNKTCPCQLSLKKKELYIL